MAKAANPHDFCTGDVVLVYYAHTFIEKQIVGFGRDMFGRHTKLQGADEAWPLCYQDRSQHILIRIGHSDEMLKSSPTPVYDETDQLGMEGFSDG